ncbi:hypothetical protein AB7M37_006326 [Sinorhizobium fredii]
MTNESIYGLPNTTGSERSPLTDTQMIKTLGLLSGDSEVEDQQGASVPLIRQTHKLRQSDRGEDRKISL